MKFKNRLIRDKEGGLEIRLSFRFTKDEVKALDKIPDDPNVAFSTLREAEGDPYQKVEWYFTWLRLICFWTDIWSNRDKHTKLISDSIQKRLYNLEKNSKRKRRKKR